MPTKQCNSYIDFLGLSATQFYSKFGKYIDHVCVYAMSATNSQTNTAVNTIASADLAKVDNQFWSSVIAGNLKFAKSTSNTYMCYKFNLTQVTTESDNEPEAPYSYEEFLNENVLQNMNASTAMQYKNIWKAYTENDITDADIKNEMSATFCSTNNVSDTSAFKRTDYYKFFVPETDIIHNRSLLELNDDSLASVSNSAHDSFNCLMYCINPNFDNRIDEGENNLPKGFSDSTFIAVPISLCTYSLDITLAGNNTVFEPNLNGIVTAE